MSGQDSIRPSSGSSKQPTAMRQLLVAAIFAAVFKLFYCNGEEASPILYRDDVLKFSKRPVRNSVHVSRREDKPDAEDSSLDSMLVTADEDKEQTHLQVISDENQDGENPGSLEKRDFPWQLIFGQQSRVIQPIVTFLSFGLGMLAWFFLIESPLSPLPVPPLPFPPVGPYPPLDDFNHGVHPVKQGLSLFGNGMNYGRHRIGRRMNNFAVGAKNLISSKINASASDYAAIDVSLSDNNTSLMVTDPEKPSLQEEPCEDPEVTKCYEVHPHNVGKF